MSNTIKVLQFSTHDEDCGIAKYQQQFVDNMNDESKIVTKYFRFSPNHTKNMSKDEFRVVLSELKEEMKKYDVLHIQHELSFFKFNELQQIVSAFKDTDKKLIVTVHTAPQAQFVRARLGGLGPRSFAHYGRSKVSNRRFINKYIKPLTNVDRVVVHNKVTRQNLVEFGIPKDKILIIKHPVSKLDQLALSTDVHDHLNVNKGDIVYATVGFISVSKGVFHAVKALNFLPDNYKLAILGGVHPDSNDTAFLDELSDYIYEHGLSKRVYITGYIKSDERLNSLIREVDICVYPYSRQYYDYVSSGSLNLAMANKRPVIAYPTRSLLEINEEAEAINFTKSGNYYELARAIMDLDIPKYSKASERYAEKYAWDKEAKKFIELYASL